MESSSIARSFTLTPLVWKIIRRVARQRGLNNSLALRQIIEEWDRTINCKGLDDHKQSIPILKPEKPKPIDWQR